MGDPDAPEVDGLVVRLDVYVDDASRASQVAETLVRQAAGYAAEGIVASVLCHPHRLTIAHDCHADEEDEP